MRAHANRTVVRRSVGTEFPRGFKDFYRSRLQNNIVMLIRYYRIDVIDYYRTQRRARISKRKKSRLT